MSMSNSAWHSGAAGGAARSRAGRIRARPRPRRDARWRPATSRRRRRRITCSKGAGSSPFCAPAAFRLLLYSLVHFVVGLPRARSCVCAPIGCVPECKRILAVSRVESSRPSCCSPWQVLRERAQQRQRRVALGTRPTLRLGLSAAPRKH
jgi:hypothetical protein